MARRQIAWGIFALVLSSALLLGPVRAEDDDGASDDDEYADASRAHLVVRKWCKEELVVQGKNVTVDIDIFNAGISTASLVKFVDKLPAEATLIEGSLVADIGKIAIGSHAKLSYVVVFNTGSIELTLPPARVTYAAETDSNDLTEGASSSMALYIMTPVQQLQRYALHAGAYASLGFAKTPADWRNMAIVVGLVGSALGANFAVKKVKSSTVNRKRAAALRELEKSE
ncbi:hypothetical protein TSOC_005021 [Tetrabaena socialis]|uniref:Translocon-associated protein subunit beta n=1 Tax=Tetrabaena socialis TaxID=47790 RepID=A0A2J8A797_9CHLO|nr:hypothetical protein TSOC_005021 [Tetrabaena socialis]|eukprot:PNH08416.1 hypothetical protein TSOC_005021 [Tetrabaena socialis]